MRALGLTVDMPGRGRPAVRAVLAHHTLDPASRPSLADVSLVAEFDLTTSETDWARIAIQFFHDVSGRVSTLLPDIVVVRRADMFGKGRLGDGPRLRLVVEGAITAAAASHVASTHLWTGEECARKGDLEKGAMDVAGRKLVTKANRADAGAAAISGLLASRK